jgi:hypothetical protein
LHTHAVQTSPWTGHRSATGGASSTRAEPIGERVGLVLQCWRQSGERTGDDSEPQPLRALQRPRGRTVALTRARTRNGATVCVAPARHLVAPVVSADAHRGRGSWLRPLARCGGYGSRRYGERRTTGGARQRVLRARSWSASCMMPTADPPAWTAQRSPIAAGRCFGFRSRSARKECAALQQPLVRFARQPGGISQRYSKAVLLRQARSALTGSPCYRGYRWSGMALVRSA